MALEFSRLIKLQVKWGLWNFNIQTWFLFFWCTLDCTLLSGCGYFDSLMLCVFASFLCELARLWSSRIDLKWQFYLEKKQKNMFEKCQVSTEHKFHISTQMNVWIFYKTHHIFTTAYFQMLPIFNISYYRKCKQCWIAFLLSLSVCHCVCVYIPLG